MGNSSEARKGCCADAGVRDFWAAVARDETLMQPWPPLCSGFEGSGYIRCGMHHDSAHADLLAGHEHALEGVSQ